MIALMLAAALAGPVVSHAEIRPTFGANRMTAAYMTVQAPVADRLVAASCACALSVELHQTVVTNGVARMTGPAPVDVPAGQPVVFAPGGRHLMVMGLKTPLKAGDKVTFKLRFEKAGAVQVEFSAQGADKPHAMGAMPGMDGMDHH